jgi:hypothetical protein
MIIRQTMRNFSGGMMRDSGIGNIQDDEFLPDFEQ